MAGNIHHANIEGPIRLMASKVINNGLDYSISTTDYRILITTEGDQDRYITLPAVKTSHGQEIVIKRMYAINQHSYIIRPKVNECLEGATDTKYTLDEKHECVILQCDKDFGWIIITSY